MNNNNTTGLVEIVNPSARGDFVLVCEHASNTIPEALQDLGLNHETKHSHIAWDLGADSVSRLISQNLDSPLVSSRISRLVYDCNRAPNAPDAIPSKSEIYEVPGNTGLSDDQREQRFQKYYLPFEYALSETVKGSSDGSALVSIHSFTPVYFGQQRKLEIGLIHDEDPRLAEQMFALASEFCGLSVALNQPYSMQDGTTHTIHLHGTQNRLANMMIEIRNDLIDTESNQIEIARMLSNWLLASLEKVNGRIQ